MIREHIWSRAFTGLLIVACGMFGFDSLRDRAALRDFASHVGELAESGGGVLFVFRPADCLATAELAQAVADTLRAGGLAVRGLVIKDGVASDGLALVLDEANERFPHVATSARGAVQFIGRAGTPAALGVRSDGAVLFVERLAESATPGSATSTAGRLRRQLAPW